jgi:hypothetical protein
MDTTDHRCDTHANAPVLYSLCRAAGKSVAETLTAGEPSAVVKCLDLDTADINSIKQLANVVKHEYDQQIDLLVSMSMHMPNCSKVAKGCMLLDSSKSCV